MHTFPKHNHDSKNNPLEIKRCVGCLKVDPTLALASAIETRRVTCGNTDLTNLPSLCEQCNSLTDHILKNRFSNHSAK